MVSNQMMRASAMTQRLQQKMTPQNSIKLMATLAASILLLSACATTPSNSLVYQNANNEYEVTGVGRTELTAKNNAIAAANSTCGSGKIVVVSKEQNSFNGVLKGVVDEQTGKMVNAAAGVLGVFTGKSADLSRDDDYQTQLSFTCKNRS